MGGIDHEPPARDGWQPSGGNTESTDVPSYSELTEQGDIGWWILDEMFAVAIFILSLMICQPGVTIQEKVNWRVSRAAERSAPKAVNCQLSSWSEWTDCFPCQHKKYRYRTLLQPNKYEGTVCSGDTWGESSCRGATGCITKAQCGQDFQCKETGRCLKRHLVCNGDHDCSDESDEKNCEDAIVTENECSQYDAIPGSEGAASGYNILTQRGALNVYDAKYYGGLCETVYNGEWRELRYNPVCEQLYYGEDEKYFRKPYNFLTYRFVALADTSSSSEFYENTNELFEKLKDDWSVSGEVMVGIGLAKVPVTVDVSVSGSWASSFLNQLRKYNKKGYRFMRIFTKVQTAHFKMRRDNIMLDEGVLQSLRELPEQYNYGMYAKFISDYGTHYITSGSMGGIYEYFLVLDQKKMESQKVTFQDIEACLGGSVGLTYTIWEGVKLSGGVPGKLCQRYGDGDDVSFGKNSVVVDVIPRVLGGSTGPSFGVVHNSSIISYRSWGKALKYNPTIIDFETQPIHELLRHANLGPVETKRQNLKRALDQYLTEFSACRCGPCFNNGLPVLEGTGCKCQCPPGSRGRCL